MAAHSKTMWHHVRRSPYQALAAILIMMVTFLVVSVFTYIIAGSHVIINYFESKPQVTIFFKNDTKKENIDAVKSQLEATGKVATIKYISQDQALSIYKQQNKEDPLLLELVTADILPPSLEVSTYNLDDLAAIASSVKSLPIVQEVGYQKDVIGTLTSWINAIRRIGIVLIAVLSLVSVFIMVTVISIKISQKKEEIEIMRLIGATNAYISMPFLYEGMFYGIVGAVVAWVIASVALLSLTPMLEQFLKNIPLFPINPLFFVGMLVGEILVGMLLGAFSSWLAVYRYLHK